MIVICEPEVNTALTILFGVALVVTVPPSDTKGNTSLSGATVVTGGNCVIFISAILICHQ